MIAMGDWKITVTGIGSHHNTGNPKDAHLMAREFAEKLKESGHRVTTATFENLNNGRSENIMPHDLPPATF